MIENIVWTKNAESEFRKMVTLTIEEDLVFTLRLHDMTTEQISERIQMPLENVNEILRDLRAKYIQASHENKSLPQYFMNRNDMYDFMVGQIISANYVTTVEAAEAIDSYIFDEDARKILKRRIIDGRTYEEIASEFDISIRSAKNICKEYGAKLIPHIRLDRI